MKQIRTRFAPSPTGFMHVGGIRTALFAWLFAQKHSGSFILRIEDTDKAREVEGSVQHILDSLEWLGLTTDEGPSVGGEYGPYLQSERLELYKKHVQTLIDKGLAYADPFTQEEVQTFREESKLKKRPFLFREYRPEETSCPEDWYKNVSIRFKTVGVDRSNWKDIVRGDLTAGEEALDDFVIMKADGFPTYNFAHVVDDHEMKITHIIRGEEFIASVPKFLKLYEALEFEAPEFITVPPILNANGGKKLSKRDGARDVLEYRDEGYEPIAVTNFLVSMGWNDGTEKEIYSMDELIAAFDVGRIQKSGAKFDETKLDWIAWQHAAREIAEDPNNFLAKQGITDQHQSPEFAKLSATKARNLEDFMSQYKIYTDSPSIVLADFDLNIVDKKLELATAQDYIQQTIALLEDTNDYSAENIESVLRAKMEQLEASPRAYLNLLRWAVTNSKVSPNLFEMISAIGKEEILTRLRKSL